MAKQGNKSKSKSKNSKSSQENENDQSSRSFLKSAKQEFVEGLKDKVFGQGLLGRSLRAGYEAKFGDNQDKSTIQQIPDQNNNVKIENVKILRKIEIVSTNIADNVYNIAGVLKAQVTSMKETQDFMEQQRREKIVAAEEAVLETKQQFATPVSKEKPSGDKKGSLFSSIGGLFSGLISNLSKFGKGLVSLLKSKKFLALAGVAAIGTAAYASMKEKEPDKEEADKESENVMEPGATPNYTPEEVTPPSTEPRPLTELKPSTSSLESKTSKPGVSPTQVSPPNLASPSPVSISQPQSTSSTAVLNTQPSTMTSTASSPISGGGTGITPGVITGGGIKPGSEPGKGIKLPSVVSLQTGVEINGLNSTLEQRVSAMAADFQQKTGKKLTITSGIRSNEKQKELFDKKLMELGGDTPENRAKARKLVAEPSPPLGNNTKPSLHNSGLAIDINSKGSSGLNVLAGPRDKPTGWLESFGLTRPIPGEDWHVQLSKTPPSPDNPENPGQPVIIPKEKGEGAVNVASGENVQIKQATPETKPAASSGSSSQALEQITSTPETKPEPTNTLMAESGGAVVSSSGEPIKTGGGSYNEGYSSPPSTPPPPSTPVKSSPSTGMSLNSMSQNVESMSSQSSKPLISTVDNSSTNFSDIQDKGRHRVPSPVANRGSLDTLVYFNG